MNHPLLQLLSHRSAMQQLNCPVESHTHIFLPAACPLLAASCVTAMPRMPWGPAGSPIPCGRIPPGPSPCCQLACTCWSPSCAVWKAMSRFPCMLTTKWALPTHASSDVHDTSGLSRLSAVQLPLRLHPPHPGMPPLGHIVPFIGFTRRP